MRTLALLQLLALCSIAPLRAEETPPLPPTFANFVGSYSKSGSYVISNGSGEPVSGKASMQFLIDETGGFARLKIVGTLEINDTRTRFVESVLLQAGRRAIFTNLAPGFEDVRRAAGRYTTSRTRIQATANIRFAEVTGKAAIRATLKRSKSGTRLIVEQTLQTSALAKPLTWKFRAVRPN